MDMDPVATIMGALAIGKTSLASDAAPTALKHGYEGLQSLVKRKLVDNPKADAALAQYADDPEDATMYHTLAEQLEDAGADEDMAILEAAKAVLSDAGDAGLVVGVREDRGDIHVTGNYYSIDVSGVIAGIDLDSLSIDTGGGGGSSAGGKTGD